MIQSENIMDTRLKGLIMSNLVALVCDRCGGDIEVDSDDVTQIGKDEKLMFVFSGDMIYKCTNCGVKFLDGDYLKPSNKKGGVSIGTVPGGISGIAIGGIRANKIEADVVAAGSVYSVNIVGDSGGVAIGDDCVVINNVSGSYFGKNIHVNNGETEIWFKGKRVR